MTKDLIGFVSHKDQSYLLAGLAASSWAPLSRCGNCANTSSGFVGAVARNLPRTSSTILSSLFSTNKFSNTGNLCHHRVKPDQARVTACCDCVWSLVRSSQRAKHCPLSSLWHNDELSRWAPCESNKQTNKQNKQTNKQTNKHCPPSLWHNASRWASCESNIWVWISICISLMGRFPLETNLVTDVIFVYIFVLVSLERLSDLSFFYEVGLKMGVFFKVCSYSPNEE